MAPLPKKKTHGRGRRDGTTVIGKAIRPSAKPFVTGRITSDVAAAPVNLLELAVEERFPKTNDPRVVRPSDTFPMPTHV